MVEACVNWRHRRQNAVEVDTEKPLCESVGLLQLSWWEDQVLGVCEFGNNASRHIKTRRFVSDWS